MIFARYFVVSAIALALDCTLYLLFITAIDPVLAGAASYLSGLGLHYALSKRFVFTYASPRLHEKRALGIFLYAISGLIGMAITTLTIWIVFDQMHMDARIAKLIAIGFSFTSIYLLRRFVLFSESKD